MDLSATLSQTELRQIATGLVPLRIDLGDGETERWLDIVDILDTQLVPDEGFVVAAQAKIRWPQRRLFDSFTVPKVAMMIEPRLEPTHAGTGLVITVRCRDIDLRWVPDLIDARVVEAINERLREASVEFRWDLSDTLSFAFPQSDSGTNIESVDFDVSEAALEVDGHRVHIQGPMSINVIQKPPRSLERGPDPLPALPRARSGVPG